MENIKVCIRMRPLPREDDSFSSPLWHIEANSIINTKTKDIFTYDQIFDCNSTNNDVFISIRENLKQLFEGINLTIFVYGQTSTGKTFTMRGNDNSPGLIPFSVKEIFNYISNEKDTKNEIKVSYMEIYNEMINDLLDSKKKNLEVRESVQKGIFVDNLTEISVDSYERVNNLIKQGDSVKMIAETKLNELSSRSHTIFRVSIESNKKIDGKNKIFYSQFNLVDLAGSENASKAKTEGTRMKEGSNINKSLLALSMVIYKLSQNQKSFINYRDSKLTRLLQSALSGNSKTTIICTISQNPQCYQETLNTLNFGTKAKTIKTTIKINELIDEKTKILQENNELKSKIKRLEDIVSEKLDQSKLDKNTVKMSVNDCSMIVEESAIDNKTSTQKNEILNNLEKEVTILKKMMMNNSNININLEEDEEMHNFNRPANFYNFSATKMSNKKRKPEEELNSTSYFKRCMTEKSLNHYNSYSGFTSNFSFLGKHYPPNGYEENEYTQYKSPNEYNMILYENEELKKSLYETRGNFIEVLKTKDNIIKNLNFNHNAMIERCDKILMENEENFINLKIQFDKCKEELIEKDEEIKNLNDKLNNSEHFNVNLQKENIMIRKECSEMLNQTKAKKLTDMSFNEMKIKYEELLEVLKKMEHELKKENFQNIELMKSLEKANEDKKNLKLTNDNLNSEMFSQKARLDMLEKNSEVLNNEINKHKLEINSYKTEITTNKEKLNMQKVEITQGKTAFDKLSSEMNKSKSEYEKLNKINQELSKKLEENQTKLSKYEKGSFSEAKVNELEKKIENMNSLVFQLESNLNDNKQKLKKIEDVDIKEYERIIEESFEKISELQTNLSLTVEKNRYLENIIKITDPGNKASLDSSSAKKKIPELLSTPKGLCTETLLNEKENIESFDENGFTKKKRKKLSKVYQNILDKKIINGGDNETSKI